MNIYQELKKFSHIKYYDEPHKYFIGEQELVSGTGFLKLFKPEFNAKVMAEKSAKKLGVPVEDVLSDWEYKREFAGMKGTLVHNFAENYWFNKIFPYNSQVVIDKFGEDHIKERYDRCVEMFLDFYRDASVSLTPVAMELVVGDAELGIAGMIDCLFYNEKLHEYQIWDYKTSRQIRMKSEYRKRFKAPISFVEECEYETYSLQLSLYKFLIEKNTNIKIGKCYLVWLFEENETYQVIECKNHESTIGLMIKHYLENKKV
jgi:ATP-dependent exoDNAse (exonuclease V) beta subunit